MERETISAPNSIGHTLFLVVVFQVIFLKKVDAFASLSFLHFPCEKQHGIYFGNEMIYAKYRWFLSVFEPVECDDKLRGSFFYLNPTNIANIWCSADEQPHLLNIIGLQLYHGLNCLLITCCAFVCFRHLLLSECIHCPEPKVFSRFEELEQHMRKQHELFCCKLCTKHLKVKKKTTVYNNIKVSHYKPI